MIEFRNIGVRYGTQEVIQNVNFRINKTERVGIIGPNGSGKSTLFRLILGEADPDTGDAHIEESVGEMIFELQKTCRSRHGCSDGDDT